MSANQKDEPTIQPSSDGTSPPPALDSSTERELITALRQNWQREMEGVRTYRGLAQRERDAARRAILNRLADAEQRHAQKWEQKLADLGAEPPQEERSLQMRFQGWL